MIDPADLLDAEQVAELLGLSSRRAVSTYRARYADFPAPVVERERCMFWARADVLAWAKVHRA